MRIDPKEAYDDCVAKEGAQRSEDRDALLATLLTPASAR